MGNFWHRTGSTAAWLFALAFVAFYSAVWIYAAYFGISDELLREFRYFQLLVGGGASWFEIFDSAYKMFGHVFGAAFLTAASVFLAYCVIRGGNKKSAERNAQRP